MKTENFDKKLFIQNNILEADETVIWEGKPEKVKLFEAPHTGLIMLRWAISAVILGATAWYWSYASAMEIPTNVIASIVVLGVLWGVVLAIRPFTNISNLHNNINYLVTNKRVIAYKRKNSFTTYIQSRKFEDITEATVVKNADGYGSLFVGPMTNASIMQTRNDIPAVVREDDYIKTMAFYNVFMPEEAAFCLPSTIAVKNLPGKAGEKAA